MKRKIGWGVFGAIVLLVMAVSVVRAEEQVVWGQRIAYFDHQQPAGIEFIDRDSNLITGIACGGKVFLNPADPKVDDLRAKVFGAALSGKPVNVIYDDNARIGGAATCQVKAIW